jgi:hypothetical protein
VYDLAPSTVFCLFYLLTVGVQGYCCAPSHSLTLGRTPLDKRSARRRNLQHTQETDIYAAGGIRTCHPNKRALVDPRLRPRGHGIGAVQSNPLIHHTFLEVVHIAKCNMWINFSAYCRYVYILLQPSYCLM